MTTLPPPGTNTFPEDSLEKKVYNLVEKYSDYLPIANDRNRLGFNLYKYMIGEGDPPAVILANAKVELEGITSAELALKFTEELSKLKELEI